MSAPAVPVPTSSVPSRYTPTVEEITLAELLDLFTPEGLVGDDRLTAEPAPPASPVASHGARLRLRMREWVRRAAAWGSGPQGAWRAW